MWNQKTGISVGNSYKIPTADLVKTLKKIGFDAVSPEWVNHDDMSKIVSSARECGLEIQSVHAPFHRISNLWSRDKAVSEPILNEILATIADCKTYSVPIAVVHTWIGFEYAFHPENLYFENFERLVAAAEKSGIKIAFENTEGEEYLFALMEHFEGNDTVGFCWDSGHEICYNHSMDLLKKFGDRLIITHLNDNLGISRFDGKTYWTDDLHLLPYDGIIDWDSSINRLKQSKRLEILNFELNIKSKPNRLENEIYGQMSLEQYFTEAYKRACKIAYRYINQ